MEYETSHYLRSHPHGRRAAAVAGRLALRRCLPLTPLPNPAGQRGPPGRPPPGRLLAAGQALDHQPRPRLRAKKKARDRLIRLAESHPDWVLGYQDECWWSRLAQPDLHAWAEEEPLRLVELSPPRGDPDRKALCCYGLFRADTQEMLLRFVDGRPVSQVTTDYLAWVCARLAAEGKKALALVG